MPPRQYPGTAPAQATGIHRHDGGRATPKILATGVWQPGCGNRGGSGPTPVRITAPVA